MKLTTIFFLLVGLVTPIMVSCNIYSPFATLGSDDDRIEAALECLHDGDFECAIANYSLLENTEEKNQHLCTVNMARAGLSLTALTSVFKNASDSKFLGQLATQIIPWDSTKQTAAENALTVCATYAASASDAGLAALLKNLSFFTDCAVRIAKTDSLVANADDDTACTTAGNGSGTITAADIGGDASTGTIPTNGTGMCPSDVDKCLDDLTSINSSELSNSGLNNIKGALDQVPAELKNENTLTNAARVQLRSSVAN